MVVGAAVVTLLAGAAHAADRLMQGSIFVAKETTVLKGTFKPASGTFPLPALGTPADPLTGAPVTITVFDTSGSGGTFSEPLIIGTVFPEGWKGLGTPPGSQGFKYENTNGGTDPGEPCKIVIIKETIIKFVCKGADVDVLAGLFLGSAEITIDFNSGGGGDRYCAEFGGTTITALAPLACPGCAWGLADGDGFGRSVASLGDVDGDGVGDAAVGVPNDGDGGPLRGAVWILFLNTDNTVKAAQKISDTAGGFGGTLEDDDSFGELVGTLGDLDGDGIPDLAVGAPLDDDGGPDRGAVYVLFLNADGTVKGEQKISDLAGGFAGTLL